MDQVEANTDMTMNNGTSNDGTSPYPRNQPKAGFLEYRFFVEFKMFILPLAAEILLYRIWAGLSRSWYAPPLFLPVFEVLEFALASGILSIESMENVYKCLQKKDRCDPRMIQFNFCSDGFRWGYCHQTLHRTFQTRQDEGPGCQNVWRTVMTSQTVIIDYRSCGV